MVLPRTKITDVRHLHGKMTLRDVDIRRGIIDEQHNLLVSVLIRAR